MCSRSELIRDNLQFREDRSIDRLRPNQFMSSHTFAKLKAIHLKHRKPHQGNAFLTCVEIKST